MEDTGRDRLRTMLGELPDHTEGAEEVASGIRKGIPSTRRWSRRYGMRRRWCRWRTNWKATAGARATIDESLYSKGTGLNYSCARSATFFFPPQPLRSEHTYFTFPMK